MTSRNYCFTAYLEEEVMRLKDWPKTKYICWGVEICPTTGRQHFQGYIELNDAVRIAAFKKSIYVPHILKNVMVHNSKQLTIVKKMVNFLNSVNPPYKDVEPI